MGKKSTSSLLGFVAIFVFGILGLSNSINAQNCATPTGLNTTNLSNFSVTANWSIDNNVDHYRLRYREVGTTNWLFEHNILASTSHDLTGLTANSTYIWQLKAYCSAGNSDGSSWSVADSFLTTNYPVDCYNTPNGTAYFDSCGICVGGLSGASPCIPFSPTVSIALSTYECNSVADIIFSTSQDPNEPDISSSVFSSDNGSFNFTGLNNNDTIGSGTLVAGGGYINISTTLLVDFIITSDKISVKALDNITGSIYGSFTIENSGGGVLVVATSLPDNNNVTSGNSQLITLNGLFVNPSPSMVTFTSTLNSELGDVDVQTAVDSIACTDCNNDFGGTAYTDSCGNCVGGNTGNVACIAFSPTVTVALSNTNCDSLTDLTINVSQDPNEPDMATSLFTSDGGYFAISTMSVGDTIGSAVMQTGPGINFNTVLIVNSIISVNQAIIQSKDITTGLVLGTFTISNSNPGVNITAQSIPDNNNVTSGNSQSVTFNNVFVNPGQGTLIFTSTINSELGDVDIQTFAFNIACLCVPNGSTTTVVACDSLSWNGVTYTTSGTYTFVTTNVDGCDSTATLNLTINNATTSTTTVSANNSYTWNGVTYTTSGTYTYSTTNASGCDSTATLILTINVCDVPTNTYTSNILLDRATMNWSSVVGSDHYIIRFKAVSANTWQIINEYGTSRTKAGLSPATYYHWQVSTSCDAQGNFVSAWSDTNTFQTMIPCTTPTNPVASAALNSALLSWDANPNAWAFRIKYRKTGSWIIDTTYVNSITLTGLDNSSVYNWRVQAICDSNGNNNSLWTANQTFNTLIPCANPTALTVDSVGVNEAYLSWNGPIGVDHYVVLYSELGSGIWDSASTSNTNIALTGLATYSDYQWQLIAFCEASGINNSDTITGANFSTANPCTVPQNLGTSNVLLDRMTFNWNAVALAHHYELRWREQGGTVWNNIINIYSTSRTKTGLAPSTTYEWQVRSICDAPGTSFSDWSATQTETTLSPCSTPTNPTSSNILLTSAQLDWDAVSGAIAYRLRYRPTGGSWIFDTLNTNAAIITGLTAGTNYQWQVKSMCDINGNNNSVWTSSQTFSTLATCTAPTSLSVAQITLNSVKFVIYGPSNPNHYYVLYKDTTVSVWDTLTITSADISGTYASKVVTGLTSATTYEWKAQASCQAGDVNLSAFTIGQNFATLTPCAIPTNLAYSINGQDATFTWDVVAGAVSYTAKYRALGNTLWQTVTVTNPTFTVNNLGYGLSYEWAVSSNCDYNGINSSAYSSIDTFNTASCPDPLNISMSNITTSSVTISWTNNTSVHHYALRGRVVGTTVWTKNVPYIYGSNRTINGLNSGTAYEFQIRSACTSDTSNVSPWSALQSVTTLVNCSAKPTSLTTTNVTLSTADLSFTGTANAVAYIVRFKPSSAAGSAWVYDTLIAPTVALSKSGLSANTYYSWQVKAVCDLAVNNASAWTAQSQFSTLIPCQNPSGLNVHNNQTTTTSFKASWHGSPGVYAYEVLIKDSTTTSWDTVIITSSSVTTTGISATASLSGAYVVVVFNGLTAGTTYEWKVMTQCAAGGINNSSLVSGPNVTTVPPCSTPTGLVTTAITANNATVNWGATLTAHHYDIRGRIVGTTGWSINTAYQYNTSRTFSGLTAGTNYEWQVRSVCSSDTSEVSAWSSSATFTTMVSCDNPPSNLNETNIGLTTATLNWDIQANVQAYQLRFKQSNQGGSAWVYSTISSSTTLLNKTGLSSVTDYSWQIRAICDTLNAIVSPWSPVQTFTTEASCQTPNALHIRGNLTTLTSVTVRWLSPVNTSLVMFREVGANSWDTISVSGSTVTNVTLLPFGIAATTSSQGQVNDVVFTGLTSATTYEWQVIAYCSSYNQSAAVSGPNFSTITGCQVPTGLSSYAGTSSTQVSWTVVSGAVKYELRKREQGTAWGNNIVEYGTSRTFNGLTPGVTYEWEVRSHCDNSGTNISAWTATQTFTTQNLCTAPTNPGETNITATSADLVWDALPGAHSYKIKWRQIGTPVTVTTITNNSLSLSGLNPSSSFKWKVKTNCDSLLTNVSPFTPWQYFSTPSNIRITGGDAALGAYLNIYPNPTRGIFNINFVSEEVDNFEITIVDTYGKVINQEYKREFVGEYTQHLDLTEYPRGIYMVQIRTKDSFVSKRVVLQ